MLEMVVREFLHLRQSVSTAENICDVQDLIGRLRSDHKPNVLRIRSEFELSTSDSRDPQGWGIGLLFQSESEYGGKFHVCGRIVFLFQMT